MQTKCYCATDKDTGRSVLTVLKQEMHISSSMVSRLKRISPGITVNGIKAYVTYALKPGDLVHVVFPTEIEPGPDAKTICRGFSIIYEDAFFLVINKPAGISVQPVKDPAEVTLESYLKEYLHTSVRPHPVSRLDKGTSGLMCIAKNAYVHELFKQQMHTGAYYKEYRAILCGCPESREGQVEHPIGYYEGSTYARCVRADGAPSISKYEILYAKNDLSFAKLIPVTGRTHQLRVHMAYMGYPLLGDWLYGQRSERIDRAALHSYYLMIKHPVTGCTLEITCPIPEDMYRVLND